MRTIVLLLAMIPASACAGWDFARAQTISGAQQLTGARLRAAVIDRLFTYPPPDGLYSSPTCHRFHADGTYQECGDRIAFYHGTYTLTHDRICATGGPGASCWQLYVGSGGDYLLRDLRDPRADKRICISPRGEEPPPCV